MPSNFPGALDGFTTPAGTQPLGGSSPVHTTLHTNEGDAIEALEAKVGTNESAVTSSLDFQVRQLGGELTPHDHGTYKAWTYDPALAVNASLLTNGTIYLAKVIARRIVTITKVAWWVTTAGATPTAGQNAVALLNDSGVVLAQTNVDADISSTGLKETTISSQVLAPASYYVAVLFNAATAPTLARATSNTGVGTAVNLGLSASTFRFATNGTGQTSITNRTMSSNAQPTFAGPWAAIG